MTTTNTSAELAELVVPAELQPYFREPTGDDIALVSPSHGDWAIRRHIARREALGWAQLRKREHDRDTAAQAAAQAMTCQVCGQGGATETRVQLPRLGGPLAGYDQHTITAHPRCVGDLTEAVAERRRTTHRNRLDKLIDTLGIEA